MHEKPVVMETGLKGHERVNNNLSGIRMNDIFGAVYQKEMLGCSLTTMI